jgi:small subunit ribosomal protein S16
MALKIRLQRKGTRHAPVYRMVVAESTYARNGRFVELLGTYAPQARGQDKELALNLERIDYWLGIGALPSETGKDLIRKARKLQPVEEAVEPVKEAAKKPVEESTEQPVEPVAEKAAVEEPVAEEPAKPATEVPAES